MSEEQSTYDRLTKPHDWPNPAPFVPKENRALTTSIIHAKIAAAVRSGETQFAGKYDDPDARPDDERWEPGKLAPGIITTSKIWSSGHPPEFDEQALKDRILDAARADDEHGVIAKHLAAERAECEHIALFTLRDSLTEDGTSEEQVHTARLLLLYLLETR